MAGGSIRGVEYVVTDEARNVVAVVRPVPGRPPGGVPRWAGDVNACAVVVVGPDRVAGLVITKRGFDNAAHILVEPKALIGTVKSDDVQKWLSGGGPLTFRDCTCGRPPRQCTCGARNGSVQPPSRADGARAVVDAQQHDGARITSRPFTMDRRQTSAEGIGAKLGHWVRSAAQMPPDLVVCEVVEADPRFDWRRHGLLVALAALCDRNAALLALPALGRRVIDGLLDLGSGGASS
jgi:hypothetical protein